MLCDKYPPFVMPRERDGERFCIQMLCCGAHLFVCAALEGSHFKKERLSEGLLHSGALGTIRLRKEATRTHPSIPKQTRGENHI